MAGRRRISKKGWVRFLDALRNGSTVYAAAKAAGVGYQSCYDKRKRDPEFAREWEDAVEQGTDVIEDEARRRAVDGVEEPVFYQGVVCGHVTKYSDTLLLALLNARRPEKFKRQPKYAGVDPDLLSAVYVYRPGGAGDDGEE